MLSFRPSYFFYRLLKIWAAEKKVKHLRWKKGSVFFPLSNISRFYMRFKGTPTGTVAINSTRTKRSDPAKIKKESSKLKMSLLFRSRFALRWRWCEWDFSFAVLCRSALLLILSSLPSPDDDIFSLLLYVLLEWSRCVANISIFDWAVVVLVADRHPRNGTTTASTQTTEYFRMNQRWIGLARLNAQSLYDVWTTLNAKFHFDFRSHRVNLYWNLLRLCLLMKERKHLTLRKGWNL